VGAQAPAFHNNNNKEKVMPKVGNKKFPYTAKGKADAAESKRQRAMRPKAKKQKTASQQMAESRQKAAKEN
jgi:hypothetical protein